VNTPRFDDVIDCFPLAVLLSPSNWPSGTLAMLSGPSSTSSDVRLDRREMLLTSGDQPVERSAELTPQGLRRVRSPIGRCGDRR
jgi:hypothetical protein